MSGSGGTSTVSQSREKHSRKIVGRMAGDYSKTKTSRVSNQAEGGDTEVA